MKCFCGLFLLASLSLSARGQILVQDDFSGAAVDSSLWEVILPFPQSSVTQSSGWLTAAGRGSFATQQGFDTPIGLLGRMQLNDLNENFAVKLRTDLSTNSSSFYGQYYEITGVQVVFSAPNSAVYIHNFYSTSNVITPIASADFEFEVGRSYDFEITDDTTNVIVLIDGTNILAAATTFRTGNRIAFQSREAPFTSTSLDFIMIEQVGSTSPSDPPVITQQPMDQQVVAGGMATFSVDQTGTAPFFYQWLFGSAPIAGATNSELILTDVQPSQAGFYSVIVSNAAADVTSEAALLSVVPVVSDVLVDANSPGYYNNSLGTILDGTGPQFPQAFPTGGDPDLFPADEPVLAAAATVLGDWLQAPPVLNDNWHWEPTIPSTWSLNTETAIIYPIFVPEPGIANVVGDFDADNGLFVWVNGQYKFGAVQPGVPSPIGQYEYTNVNLGPLPPGLNYIQVLREDHGILTGYQVRISRATGANQAPLADAGATQTLLISPNGSNAVAVLDGSLSSDPDGDPLTYEWYVTGAASPIADGVVAMTALPLGTNQLTLVVNDGIASGSQDFTVEVITTVEAIDRLARLAQTTDGHSQPLVVSLWAALASLDRSQPEVAINQLEAFKNKVMAQVMPADSALAEQLLAAAQEIIDALNDPSESEVALEIVSIQRGNSGKPTLNIHGRNHRTCVVEMSTNLVDWTAIGVANKCGDGTFAFEDGQAINSGPRFYRIVSPK